MHFLQISIVNCDWFGRNIAHNLDFIPDDKLNWKPSPTAKSALEIMGEVIGVFDFVLSRFERPEEEWKGSYEVPLTRDEAKKKVLAITQRYIAFMQSLTPEDLEGEVQMRFGPFPKSRLVHLPVQDMTHHHGQIAYLQTIWGDETSHFFEFGS
jgi:uncharacterized damage-inducible protein DinB